MNFVLYVHDTGDPPVWDPTDPTILKRVEHEIGELIDAYTMGRVTVDIESGGDRDQAIQIAAEMLDVAPSHLAWLLDGEDIPSFDSEYDDDEEET